MDNLAQAKGGAVRQIWGYDRGAHIGRRRSGRGAALSNLRVDRALLGVARARALHASLDISATSLRGGNHERPGSVRVWRYTSPRRAENGPSSTRANQVARRSAGAFQRA